MHDTGFGVRLDTYGHTREQLTGAIDRLLADDGLKARLASVSTRLQAVPGTEKAAGLVKGNHWDRELLEELSVAMADASICGLGQAAPNPLRCVIKYFPHEI